MEKYPKKIILPNDYIAADDLENPKKKKKIDLSKNQKLPKGWVFLDIGPRSIDKFIRIIKKAGTVFWDGPMGKYEKPRFRDGTLRIAEAIAKDGKISILAGGDTAAIAENFGLIFRYSHVSIAGGATLQYLANRPMPGIEALLDK